MYFKTVSGGEKKERECTEKTPSQSRETAMGGVSNGITNTNRSKCWVVTGPGFTCGQVMTPQLNRIVEM